MSNIGEISYVIQEPLELLDKFIYEAEKIKGIPNKYDFFNFIVTASVMSEWICKHYESVISPDLKSTLKGKSDTGLPLESEDWVSNKTCLPNAALGASRYILNSIRICWVTTNATKHYKWEKATDINSIGTTAKINNHYDYFFTSVEEGLYIRYNNENYSIEQIKDILVQFYPKFVAYLEALKSQS
jgi:hypothetical protein